MIHFPKPPNPEIEAWLAHQKNLPKGKYSCDMIIEQLAEDFHHKCYICEDTVKSIRVEHFRPRVLGKDQTFDWYNLFNACEHCNAIKSDDYRHLLDCTKTFPDQEIKFEIKPMNPLGEQVVLTQLTDIHEDTINLLYAVYRGTNKRKQLEAKMIVQDIIEEINDFKDLIREYLHSPEDDILDEIREEVNLSSKFTAFKRWVIRNDPDYRAQFQPLFHD